MKVLLKDLKQESLIKVGTIISFDVDGVLVLINQDSAYLREIKGFTMCEKVNIWIDCENRSILLAGISNNGFEKIVEVLFHKEDFEKFFEPPSSPSWGNYIVALRYASF